MSTRLTSRVGHLLPLAAATAGALTIGCGPAAADPVIDTTCNYQQVLAALNAADPGAAAQFNSSPVAQAWLNQFLAAPPDQRQQLVDAAQSNPEGQPFVGAMQEVAGTCNNF